MDNYINQIQTACDFIKSKIPAFSTKIAIVLGSGLQAFGDTLLNPITISYSNIPGFPVTTVKGHAGRLTYGKASGGNILVMQGRAHLYEGWNAKEITFYVRVLQFLGINDLIITNAAGGVNKNYNPGDFVILKDYINFTGQNPLIGKFDSRLGKSRFLDMSKPFDEDLMALIKLGCEKQKCRYQQGIYACLLGPTYETPSEVRMVRSVGGDLVGMSTVLEVIAAKHGGMRIGGISLVTNMAAGMQENVNHNEVIVEGKKRANDFIKIIQFFFREYFLQQKK